MRSAIALAVLLHSTSAIADPDAFVAPTRAAKLFDEGRQLKAAGRIDEACARFAVSWQAERAPGTEVNLADCKEREGKLLEAWHLFDEAARVSERQGNTTRATFARNRAAAIEPRLQTLHIQLAAPIARGTVVSVDGRVVELATLARERMDPKDVTIRATAPDGRSFKVRVPAGAGTIVVEVPSLVREATMRRRSRLWLAGGVALAGAGSLIAGGALSIAAADERASIENCTLDSSGSGTCLDRAAVDTAQMKLARTSQLETAATVWMIGGAVSIAAAVVIWYTAPKERIVLTPTLSASSAGVSLHARW